MTANLRHILSLLALLAIAAFFNYQQLFEKAPQSYHHWRQSDVASLTLNYYQLDRPFWQPTTHGLVSDGGASGFNAPSELPFYYWGIAQIYKLSGPWPALLRALNSLIFLSGIFALILSLYRMSKAYWWSLLSACLLLSSPILIYYGNSFLPNAPSFGLALWSLYFAVRFLEAGTPKALWASFALAFFAGSFKLPGLFFFFTLAGMLLWQAHKFKAPPRKQWFLGAALVLLPLLAWVFYARYYNEQHLTMYFSTNTFPLWEYTPDEILYLLKEMYRQWWGEHFHPITSLILIIVGLCLLFLPLQDKRYRSLFRLLSLGLLAYFILQFYTFLSHDYYTINMFIWVALLLLVFTQHLRERRPALLRSPFLLVPLLLFLLFNLAYASQRLSFRYLDYPNQIHHERAELFEDNESWLQEIGVMPGDSVIYLPSDSHTPLYLLNRFGWTSHKMVFKDREPLYFNRDSAQVAQSIARGAHFLIVHGWQELYQREYLHSFLRHLSGRKGELLVFDLRQNSGYQLPQRRVLREVIADYEDLKKAPPYTAIITGASPAGGSQLLATDGSDPYLAGVELTDLAEGQLVEFTVWVKHNPEKKVLPVIASVEAGLAFAQAEERIGETADGWRHFRQSLLVDEAVARKGVKLFLWNPEQTTVLFDQMEWRLYDRNPLQP